MVFYKWENVENKEIKKLIKSGFWFKKDHFYEICNSLYKGCVESIIIIGLILISSRGNDPRSHQRFLYPFSFITQRIVYLHRHHLHDHLGNG